MVGSSEVYDHVSGQRGRQISRIIQKNDQLGEWELPINTMNTGKRIDSMEGETGDKEQTDTRSKLEKGNGITLSQFKKEPKDIETSKSAWHIQKGEGGERKKKWKRFEGNKVRTKDKGLNSGK